MPYCIEVSRVTRNKVLLPGLNKRMRVENAESLMGRFNAYWSAMLPELTPTAGYYSDGVRFLNDIDGKRRELGIEDAQLIRSR